MRPGPFSYSKPTRLSDAVVACAAGATPLSGGQSLLQAMRLRTRQPSAIVDLNAVEELKRDIAVDDSEVRIGALTTHRELVQSSIIQREYPWLARAAAAIGDVQVRNRGTIIGNICWADPRANMAVALLASDAKVVAADSRGLRNIKLADFFTGFRENALAESIATAITLPRGTAHGRYVEFSRQRQDLALVNVCVVVRNGKLQIAAGGIAPTPIRLTELESMDISKLDTMAIQSNINALGLTPPRDNFGTREYKIDVCATLLTRALNTIHS